MTESERVGDAAVWLFAFFSAHHKSHGQTLRQSRFKGMLLVVALVVFILHFARR